MGLGSGPHRAAWFSNSACRNPLHRQSGWAAADLFRLPTFRSRLSGQKTLPGLEPGPPKTDFTFIEWVRRVQAATDGSQGLWSPSGQQIPDKSCVSVGVLLTPQRQNPAGALLRIQRGADGLTGAGRLAVLDLLYAVVLDREELVDLPHNHIVGGQPGERRRAHHHDRVRARCPCGSRPPSSLA